MSNTKPPIIERLRVKNYRSLADIDIELGSMNVFVGKNGSGKSSIIDALRFVRDAVAQGIDVAISNQRGINSFRRWSAKGRPYDISIQLNFRQDIERDRDSQENQSWLGEYSFTLGSEGRGEYRVKWERLEITFSKGIQRILEIRNGQWVEFPSDLQHYFTVPISGSVLNLPRYKDILPIRTTANETPITSGDLIFNFLGNAGFYAIYPDNLREPQIPAIPYPLDEKGGNLASVLRELKRSKTADSIDPLREALNRVVEEVQDFSVKQVGGYLVTNLHHIIPDSGRQGPAFELAQESDGTLRMLGILTALYQEPPLALMTIEEPELAIHPGALGVLCDILLEASTRSQVIITTHNPDLIDRFPSKMLRVVEKVDGITHVGPISSIQRQAVAEKLFSPGELMRIEGLRLESEEPVLES
jgi:predicted ATPase